MGSRVEHPAFAKGIGAGNLPKFRPIADMLAELDVVDVVRFAGIEDSDNLVLRSVQAA
jgi:hypothetical protein